MPPLQTKIDINRHLVFEQAELYDNAVLTNQQQLTGSAMMKYYRNNFIIADRIPQQAQMPLPPQDALSEDETALGSDGIKKCSVMMDAPFLRQA
ncbi:hypothetical protein N7475_002132 [Penicillium sp. IBT 31633x]|nr:hypothetical protein N7475_002132 [Penicillium sp. IBT 31633x]